MPRSKWKLPSVNRLYARDVRETPTGLVYRCHRTTVILPRLIGKRIEVHTGQRFHRFRVLKAMLGHRCGEFCFTRKLPPHSTASHIFPIVDQLQQLRRTGKKKKGGRPNASSQRRRPVR